MAICGGLTNSCEEKRGEKQSRKGKIHPSECRVPKDTKERLFSESLPQRSMQGNRGKQQNGKDQRSLQENRDTKGTFNAMMGTIKDRNGMDLTETEDIKKRQQEYTEELHKLHDPHNHEGVITDLEPDILECEVKRALESITTNKVSGGDGIPVELLQILKDDAVKVLHLICQPIWKTQQGPQDWKRSVFIPIPKTFKLPHNCTHLTCQ